MTTDYADFRKLIRLKSPSSGSFSVEHFRTSSFIRISGFEFCHFSNACSMLAAEKRGLAASIALASTVKA
jgi:hypothetical protein